MIKPVTINNAKQNNTAKESEEILQAELAMRFDVFVYFDPRPIASGSIAQVHRAVYKQCEVAAKMRHPHVKKSLLEDACIMT